MFVICHIEISFSDLWKFLASGFWLSKFWQMQLKSTKKSKNDITLRLPCCQWNWATLLVDVLKFTTSLQILEIKPPPRPFYDEPLNIFAVRIQSSNIVYRYNTKKKGNWMHRVECYSILCGSTLMYVMFLKWKTWWTPSPSTLNYRGQAVPRKRFEKANSPLKWQISYFTIHLK